MPKDLKLRPTSDVEAKERASQDTRAEWQRPAFVRLAAKEAETHRASKLEKNHFDFDHAS